MASVGDSVGTLTAVLVVGVFAASAMQLATHDRITRAPRHRLVRRLARRAGTPTIVPVSDAPLELTDPPTRRGVAWHLMYALGCWDCGPVTFGAVGWIGWELHPITRAVVGIVAARAVARLTADRIGWTSSKARTVALSDGTIGTTHDGARDWPDEIPWPPIEPVALPTPAPAPEAPAPGAAHPSRRTPAAAAADRYEWTGIPFDEETTP